MAKQVTCDSCRRSFLASEDLGDLWFSCPYCEKVNPRAIRKLLRKILAVVLFVVVILGAVFGTLLVLQWGTILLTAVWVGASAALVTAGILLLRSHAKTSLTSLGWKSGLVVLLTLLVGVCGWVFVMTNCASPF